MNKQVHIFIIFCTLLKCGKNPFQEYDSPKAAETATVALEQHNPSKAINILLSALGTEYKNLYRSITLDTNTNTLTANFTKLLNKLIQGGNKQASNLVSILASAQAQYTGVDPFEIALRLALSSDDKKANLAGDASSASSLSALFPFLPKATRQNLKGLEISVALMNSIKTKNLTGTDKFKKSMFITSSVALNLKEIDKDGDGELSPTEILNLDDSIANSIVAQIQTAAATAQTSKGGDDPSAKALSEINSQISSQEGENSSEKLREFLEAGAETAAAEGAEIPNP